MKAVKNCTISCLNMKDEFVYLKNINQNQNQKIALVKENKKF